MAEKTIAQKLQVKPGRRLLLINAPAGYEAMLGKLPAGAQLQRRGARGAVDIIQLFAKSRAELEKLLPRAQSYLAPGGMIWVTYPKGSSKTMKADINRDSIADHGKASGLLPVAMVSIDSDWSALRFKAVG